MALPTLPRLAPLRVAVLHGGPSSEHDISVLTAGEVLSGLQGLGHRAFPVYVDREGRWHAGAVQTPAGTTGPAPMPIGVAAGMLDEIDCAFMGFHGTYGEDGKVQAVLELAGIPYTGSGVAASALAMSKPRTRHVYRGVGVPVPAAVEIAVPPDPDERTLARLVDEIIAAVGLDVAVKVPEGGSSVGVAVVHERAALEAALRTLGGDAAGQPLLVEAFVAGRELTCGVVEGAEGQQLPTAVVEIVPRRSAFFDFAAKYDPDATDEIAPAPIDEHLRDEVQRLAMLAHRSLGCAGVSRTDFIADAEGRPWALETNTLPGLTRASLLPKAVAAEGWSFAALLEAIVAAARRRHARRT
jgi:D-alanine-D-alanine ligase